MSGSPRILLGIETSQRRAGVAIASPDDAKLGDIEMLSPAGRHDDDLLPAVQRLLDRHELAPPALSAVGVSIGPGGFTGLRIAISTACMLGETLGVDLIGVPSAEAIAENDRRRSGETGPLLVALAVKGETFWASRLIWETGEWSFSEPPGLVEAASVELGGIRAIVADEHLPVAARDRAGASGIPIREPDTDPGGVTARALARWRRGEKETPLSLRPLYPRPPEAVALWNAARRPRNVQ